MNAPFAIPRINVNTASREKLIAHINALEGALINALPAEIDAHRCQYAFGLTLSEAMVLAALAKRGRASREHLRTASCRWGDRENVRVIDVLMVRIRDKLHHFNIEILSDWGVGYLIDPENLKRLRGLISERAAA
jgi:DNA-binding response OmpR family regulator